ncbi:MAG: YdcF family protein [Oscillatoria princeps RMCB-10]|jgi:vancomycin permeability regulator SanA|nr:YdcF family protein [Oscillatoria princeps RMCB-10]
MLDKWFLLNWHFALGFLAVGAVSVPLGLSGYIRGSTARRRYTDPARVPVGDVGIVFGAGVWEDGSPTPVLADRVRAGVGLYKLGRVRKLLMTGDSCRPDYSEVLAMQRCALEQGVPAEDILLDGAGLNTYDSCYRARAVFGVTRAVLVTQRYHLPRAVYIGCRLGLDAVGLGTPDWGRLSNDAMLWYCVREAIAGFKALWRVHVSRPQPTFTGPFEGIE